MNENRVSAGYINKVYSPIMSGIVAISMLATGGQPFQGVGSPCDIGQFIGTNALYVSNSKSYVFPASSAGYHYSIADRLEEAHVINNEKMNNLVKLDRIAMLPENWNQDGAPAISDSIVSYTRQLLTYLDIQPEVFPTAANSIQLEYDAPNGSYMEFEIKEECICFFSIDQHGVENTEMLPKNAVLINQLVDSIYG